MGNRANFVIVKDQDWQLYYSHWGGCRMLDALIGGPELALRYAASLRRCEKDEWCDPTWADGGALMDLDRRRVLFFGEPLMVEMNERRALMEVLTTVWPGYEVCWASTEPKNLRDMWGPAAAGQVGQAADAQARPRSKTPVPPYFCGRRRRPASVLAVVVAPQQGLAWAGIAGQLPGPRDPPDPARQDSRRRGSHRCASKDVGGLADRRHDGLLSRSTRAVARVAHRGLGGPLRGARQTVRRCSRVPEPDVVAGIGNAEMRIRERVFESFEDSPAGHIAKLAGLLSPVAPGFVVSPDALGDCGVRPTEAEWSRFRSACDLVRSVDTASA